MGSVVSALAHHSYNMKFLVLCICVLVSWSRPSFYGLVNHPNGAVVPVDEPRVAAARADHLSAVSATHGAHGHGHAAVHGAHASHSHAHAAHHGHGGPLNLNTHLVTHPNGAVVPADTPAVAAARADHFAAAGGHAGHAAVAHVNHAAVSHAGYPAVSHAAPIAAVAHAAPIASVHGSHAGYGHAAGYGHGLVSHPNGAVVPVDEPAVQAARADHLAAGGRHHY